MNLDIFLNQRRPKWQRLETLLKQSQRNLQTLSSDELDELGRLYRNATSDLALARRDFPGHNVNAYLNQLVGRAHSFLYRGEPLRWQWLTQFYSQTFPRLYRELLPYTICSFALFMVAIFIAFFTVWQMPDTVYLFMGEGAVGLVREVEQGRMWTDIEPAVRSSSASFILTNNIQVTFLTFAGGITAGLLSAWILVNNGLNIGAIFGLLQFHGMFSGLAEFVAAHGFIELSVIFLAGGCGLYMGDGLLRPGLLTRRAALVERGQDSVRLILGCVPLLIIAGLIEGFISPSGLHWGVKLAVGLSTGILLYYYWFFVGRE